MSKINCPKCFDDNAMLRWEGEGGCTRVTQQRGRDGPQSQRNDIRAGAEPASAPVTPSSGAGTSLTRKTGTKDTPYVSFEEPRFKNPVQNASNGQQRRRRAKMVLQ